MEGKAIEECKADATLLGIAVDNDIVPIWVLFNAEVEAAGEGSGK